MDGVAAQALILGICVGAIGGSRVIGRAAQTSPSDDLIMQLEDAEIV